MDPLTTPVVVWPPMTVVALFKFRLAKPPCPLIPSPLNLKSKLPVAWFSTLLTALVGPEFIFCKILPIVFRSAPLNPMTDAVLLPPNTLPMDCPAPTTVLLDKTETSAPGINADPAMETDVLPVVLLVILARAPTGAKVPTGFVTGA